VELHRQSKTRVLEFFRETERVVGLRVFDFFPGVEQPLPLQDPEDLCLFSHLSADENDVVDELLEDEPGSAGTTSSS
jgi:hypothetical protein